mmetsp:Transcript_9060/g.12052  ORF Transcript_9060/g.12052 Transcript_9060/m.12052 type:complete len:443 (-) Transcript_9060:155-1483(-)|eukprot:CAMPEP_0198144068 /NCGR_PEP_ID=MMETSP1443-20131203/12693_1 /TAXON_ID=186043 /ORGANISM="Entomoneis sp., Strain CCMP2396" /LENGTH=442 /DNA_ID=CAMNT_0043807405 /DNA_START=75 /DNA_END=1403 /DNA_ORIENTATION=+
MPSFLLGRSKSYTVSSTDSQSRQRLLESCEIFQSIEPEFLKEISERMTARNLAKNEMLFEQGDSIKGFYLLEEGRIKRKTYDEESGRHHEVTFPLEAKSINSMRVIGGGKQPNSVKCISARCRLYEMSRHDLLSLLRQQPDIAIQIAEGLSKEVRRGTGKFVTPFLRQKQQTDINYPAVAIAAGTESYYRSALNAVLNARLTGVKSKYFPKMHIQVPTRISYITGFKGLRAAFEENVNPEEFSSPTAVSLGMAIAPGIIMTPISGVLEATNAGHMNTESMATRWLRGAVPRGAREIIFGVGLNQMSDFFEERLTYWFNSEHKVATNMAGSIAAGVVSGYLSHVPHNMSTYKLLEPHRTYRDLYMNQFVRSSVPPALEDNIRSWSSQTSKNVVRVIAATLFPRGLLIRTTQIVGSFMILNGTINYLSLKEHEKIQRAMGNPHV